MAYTYFTWSLILVGLWSVVFFSLKSQRKKMLLMSFGTAPLGFSEPLFYPEYWFPPTLLNLGEQTGFDLESLIFSFAVGGLASSLYGLADQRRSFPLSSSEKYNKRHRFHLLLLSTPIWLFLILEILTSWNTIYTSSLGLFSGAVAAAFCRPDLLSQEIKGAAIFAGFYFLFFMAMTISHPGFVAKYWNHADISGIQFVGIPIEELLFAFCLGAMWSAFYEHRHWLRLDFSR